MVLVGSFIGRILSYFPWTRSDVEQLISWKFFPIIHVIFVICLLIGLIYLFKTSWRSSNDYSPSFTKNPALTETKIEHLTWLNRILVWLSGSSPLSFPLALEKWVKDLNFEMSSHMKEVNALIYGLREGSVLPTVVEIKSVETIGNNIHARILLRTSEFGFMVSVEEKEKTNGKRAKSNFTAIVTHFQCWFSLILTQKTGTVGLILQPIEKKPPFHIKMKPHSPDYDKKLKAEVAAQAIQDAVLNTTLHANLNMHDDRPKLSHDIALSESERSCYGDTDDEDVAEIANIRIDHVKSSSLRHRGKPYLNLHASSAPGTPRHSALPSKLVTNSNNLGSSMGSLSSLTRTPSGRGPAKPIRLKEKTLMIDDLRFIPEKPGDFYPIVCIIGLDHPQQNKSTHIYPDSFRDKLKFDLSSRSSKLRIILQSCADSKENLQLKATFSFDGMKMKEKTNVKVNMLGENNEGVLELELNVISSQDEKKLLQTSKLTSKSSPTLSQETSAPARSDNFGKESGSPETKVTVTTVTKIPPGSPVRQVTESSESSGQGVSFNSSSVAETVLKDLSVKTTPVHKAKIFITAVEKSPAHSSMDEQQEETTPTPTNADPPAITVDPATPTSPNIEQKPLLRNKSSGSANVRRTRSLMFGKSQKSKEKRLSMTEAETSNQLQIQSLASSSNLNRKSSFRKLFSRKKKNKPFLEDSLQEESPTSLDPSEVASSNGTLTKVKRKKSFKTLMKGKKKTPTDPH